jgi:hypothetical protein
VTQHALGAAMPVSRCTWTQYDDESDATSPTFEVESGRTKSGLAQSQQPQDRLARVPIKGLLTFSVPLYMVGYSNYADVSRLHWHWACLVMNALGLTSMNYFLATFFSSLPNMEGVFWETMLLWAISNTIVLFTQHKTWDTINDGRLELSVVTRLLTSTDVLAATADKMKKWKMATAKEQRRQLGLFTVVFCAFCTVLFVPCFVSARVFRTKEAVALVIALVTAPLYIAATGMPWLLGSVLFEVAGDQVRQITEQVKGFNARSLDFNECIRSIHRVDADISELANFARWLCLETVFGYIFAGLPWAVVGLGPQPPTDHWWSGNNMLGLPLSYACCFFCMCFVLFGIWTAAASAAVTTACDELRDALNRLRASSGGAGESSRADIYIATPDEVSKIENLLAYIDGLNEGAGMGFSLVGVKITYSLVANALISFGSVMGVLFATLLHFVHVDAVDLPSSNSTYE